MKIKVIGKSSDMSDFYMGEKEACKAYLESTVIGPSLRDAIKHKDVIGIIQEIHKGKFTFYLSALFREVLSYLIWLFSDVDPILCQEFLEEASKWDDLDIMGVKFALIELSDSDYSDFDGFVDCTINKLKFQGAPNDRTSLDYAESYLTLFEKSTVDNLTLMVDSSNPSISVDDLKKDINSKLEEDSMPKNIQIEIV